jgi:6-hydroxy-3-succinoylpyridine 3-monooxygenase
MDGAQEPVSLRTRAYVDGYNLYYGCLKGTPFKWLDPVLLIENILTSILVQDDEARPCKSVLLPCALKFFTAKILESAARDTDSVSCQARYHSALRKTHLGRLGLIEGYYAQQPAKARLQDPEDPEKWPRLCQEAIIWSLEEKQSDVNLALHVLRVLSLARSTRSS